MNKLERIDALIVMLEDTANDLEELAGDYGYTLSDEYEDFLSAMKTFRVLCLIQREQGIKPH